ncbi:MAG: tRNA-splicing endonuclease [Candidatus Micrarchaeota archaeon]|nr:MAG: tRNA-splicing endonuclease [Candidatus Micrarchaeota archaeon]
MLKLELSGNSAYSLDLETFNELKEAFIGAVNKDRVYLKPEEIVYLMEVRGAKLYKDGRELDIDHILRQYSDIKRFYARYATYKDWRERGLYALTSYSLDKTVGYNIKEYSKKAIELPSGVIEVSFIKDDLISLCKINELSELLYNELWFGQYGNYKDSSSGMLVKYDIFETLYLIDKGIIKANYDKEAMYKSARRRHRFFDLMYNVYADWRDNGFVVKSGFKFGSNFRIYFPGIKPSDRSDNKISHSKHVLHVFPENSKLLTSEWARAIRVAHSVKKSFILAIPQISKVKRIDIDFVLYHRDRGFTMIPNRDKASYAIYSLAEDEYIDGKLLLSIIERAKEMNLNALISIADRESSVTYYKLKEIRISDSNNRYFEIEWMQP